jgi:hypothetical protein
LLNEHLFELSAAAAFEGQQCVAVLVHGTPVFIDLTILQRHELVTDRTTENSTEQGCHERLPKKYEIAD